MWLKYSNQTAHGLYVMVGYYSPGCEGSNWASEGWWRIEPGHSAVVLYTTNDYSTFYAESDNGEHWSGPYAQAVPYNAFDDFCWSLGVTPGIEVGMRLVHCTNAWYPWVGTINLT